MITLRNEFHNTEVTCRLTLDDLRYIHCMLLTGRNNEQKRARRAARRIEKQLCGVEGCTCGDTFGARPSYEAQLDPVL